MSKAQVKVYAALGPADKACHEAVLAAGASALGHEDGLWLMHEGDEIRISFEGVYFPVEDVLAALDAHLSPEAQGKLDYLDLDDWTLTRHVWRHGSRETTTRSLNHVLDYSGH